MECRGDVTRQRRQLLEWRMTDIFWLLKPGAHVFPLSKGLWATAPGEIWP